MVAQICTCVQAWYIHTAPQHYVHIHTHMRSIDVNIAEYTTEDHYQLTTRTLLSAVPVVLFKHKEARDARWHWYVLNAEARFNDINLESDIDKQLRA